jgi:hypothetical protein
MGTGQSLRNVLVWRHGLEAIPSSLADLRAQINRWFAEDGRANPRSIGITIPYGDVTIDGSTVIGFNTGISVSGARFKIRHCYIDAAGYAVEVSGSKDTSLIDDVQTRALWGTAVEGSDALGDHSYRPGTAFYIAGGADGLQLNSVMAIGWVNGIWLAGKPEGNDWLISLLQPDIETPANGGKPTAGIKTTGAVRRLTIVDPRVVADGSGGGEAAGLDFGHSDPDAASAANNNVTVIGGTVEATGIHARAVVLRAGSTGTLLGTTLNLTDGDAVGPLVQVEKGVGRWAIVAPRLSGVTGEPWIRIDPEAVSKISIEDVFPDPTAEDAKGFYDRTFERRWFAWDSSVPTVDGSPRAVETVETLARGTTPAPLVSYRRNGAEIGQIVAGDNWMTLVLPNLPTSSVGLPHGALWNRNGALMIAR